MELQPLTYWIGGQMLDPNNMLQALNLSAKQELPSPIEGQYIHNFNIVDLETTFSQNRFGSFKIRSKERQSVVGCGAYLTSFLNNHPWANEYLESEMKKAPKFLHGLMTLTKKMEPLAQQNTNSYKEDYAAFIRLIMESFGLSKALKPSSPLQDKLNAYLALQMLKRFSFNYVYMMLSDLTKDTPSFALTEGVSSRAVWVVIKQTKKFGDQKKNRQVKNKLLEIRNKNPYCFQSLCTEHPVQIVHFIFDRPTVETETEEDIYNAELLKKIREVAVQIYDNPEREVSNIKRVIEKQYHHKTFHEMVTHYQNPTHLLGNPLPGINHPNDISEIKNTLTDTIKIIEGNNEKKLENALLKVKEAENKLSIMVEIPRILSRLEILDLKNPENYITGLYDLLYLKKVAQLSKLDQESKKVFQLSIEQLTTILYMNALSHISGFK